MCVIHLSTHWAGSLRWQGQRTLLRHISSSEISAEGLQLSFCQITQYSSIIEAAVGDVVSPQNNSLLIVEITASLLIGNKKMWHILGSTNAGQQVISRSSV